MVDSTPMFVPKYQPLDKATFKPITDKLPPSLFRKNRERFFSLFSQSVQTEKGDFALFRGASEVPMYSSDIHYPEYQEAYFYYLTGVVEMDCYLIVDLHEKKVTLFVP